MTDAPAAPHVPDNAERADFARDMLLMARATIDEALAELDTVLPGMPIPLRAANLCNRAACVEVHSAAKAIVNTNR
ncbi:hypothetical protein [Tomitella fengzijianii]|uniref:Uncharacterized protein n=1 Tax=Tomitella fengzijianii TaxID=2597660 RepID=A0A516X4H4_9ACTN|nr:hypothetical protein [Tomitella fengzijianii]QDQ97967.1 hypothetical protein FO059_12390 [Tomitella fengzijianii]